MGILRRKKEKGELKRRNMGIYQKTWKDRRKCEGNLAIFFQ
jgi:hypothetical protein